jgi:tetratricopeptide (TPR) repeat protein
MQQEYPEEFAKALAFFEKASEAASNRNFDYAIGLYLEGLRLVPDAVQHGHLPLCELALKRKSEGGKRPTMVERAKRMGGKTPLERLLNAEYLFAKDPEHLPYAEAMLRAAVAGGFIATAGWLANLIFQKNNAAEEPSLHTYLLLKNSYAAIGQFDKAVAACQRALKLKPDDAKLAEDLKNLSAEATMHKGKYDSVPDFMESVRDLDRQEKLAAQEGVVKTEDQRALAVQAARETLARFPDLPQSTYNLAQTLAALESDESENEAVQLLENAYQKTKDFGFKQRSGQIRIKQLKRRIRLTRADLEANPNNDQARAKLNELTARLNDVELEHYRLCVENYPTDLRVKYDYGICLLRNEKYDQAIPLFQDVQKDPYRRVSAMDKIGLCFFKKGWFTDAIDVFTKAIDAYEIENDDIAKELRYNLARAYEESGNTQKALETYRKIAQIDFAFRDVSQRVDKLRTTPGGSS